MKSKKGLVLVYTGNGKGKTTAAMGLALRAIGHGEKVYMIQFMKGNPDYGEVRATSYLPNFHLVQKGRDCFVKKGDPHPEDLRLAREGAELARQVIAGGEYDLVILDEINVAVDFGLVSEEDVLSLIDLKPEKTTLVLTGRYASEKLMEKADMVSEVREIKHHFKKGIGAQPGIEY
ncbi:cob(I)yrinic acid a,c-diamide adenosyltransferase [Thermosediminibacter oceani]|uniref:Cob(I)yrinic acid a,c-diamide adenosyltransferase n=1 Tax=Thermosediminibacter oceani (strain ATCC BAA-1034 / DSM 16646 / JW/IW-1228P) TaxID=555079 RepID=D9S367_THEOJ|nr:cob(I)yrinic acid a,c-diamide adenosyltransferase [Thermosediminibacter oceani]ADL07844.1 cob(I)yrinic acid a,c-diamide adenosyltransferase [Thermosediminibacter oceani DSM 16646]